ncbi:SPOR domain-containing protein [Thiovibrio frasassiensis]|uniref:SPOR domain-containing protein n=1 Tax=Thiovibrio frasassiensis TaxID=2984131 RepID=A0A9X4RL63_9BACT|nr:SPOR domain-containing protein [Thiovibrio frasassiensis]MDG4474758.1 SPOR domain-containing protein [Thiovibrio frasassiensis]
MAAGQKKGRFVVRFELGLLGMFSLTLVTGCIFFWMFIIGIWAGQTILQPTPGEVTSPLAKLAGVLQPGKPAAVEPAVPSGQKADVASEAGPPSAAPPASETEWAEAEPSVFALQVAAVRDQERAQQDVAQWRGRGYDAFSVPPEDQDDPFIRIYVGKFDKLAEANQLLAKLEKEEKVKAYIALLPASRLQAP